MTMFDHDPHNHEPVVEHERHPFIVAIAICVVLWGILFRLVGWI
jgi:hypothetical protein